MDELERRLNQVLSDPKAMAEVSRLARQLSAPGEGEAPPGSPPGGLPEGLPAALPGLLRQLEGGGHPLAKAMGPYLKEERRRRLERALGVARAARMAEGVLRGMGGGYGI